MLNVDGAVVQSGVKWTATNVYYTQPVLMAGRKKQTIKVVTDKAVTYSIQISLDGVEDADFATTTDSAVTIANASSGVQSVDYACNAMRLIVTVGAADATPTIEIGSQPIN